MKKMLTIAAVALMAVASQAATLQWGVEGLFYDNQNGLQDGGVGPMWARSGINMYLVLGSVTEVKWDTTMNSGSGGWVNQSGSLINPMFTTATDGNTWNAGNHTQADPVTKEMFGVPELSPWDDMNAVTLTMITISGDFYNLYSGNANGFAQASGSDGVGGFATSSFDASGAGKWATVPEPTSLALLAIGAAAVGLRRRIRK